MSDSSGFHGAKERPRRAPLPALCNVLVLGIVMAGLYYASTPLWPTAKFRDFYGVVGNVTESRHGRGEDGLWFSGDAPPRPEEEGRVRRILALWEASPLLGGERDPNDPVVREAREEFGGLSLKLGLGAPHLEDCEARVAEYVRQDSRGEDGSRPVWSLWKGRTGSLPHDRHMEVDDSEEFLGNKSGFASGPFPPWVEGGDEDNLPMTRRVQRDLWLLQHPRNCSHDSVRFLVAQFPPSDRLGLGAQVVNVGGLLAIAMHEKRVLVLEDLDRAAHEGCAGKDSFGRWSCYFLPETTEECRRIANKLQRSRAAHAQGKVLRGRQAERLYNPWFPPMPDLWGQPWEDLQPTTEIDGRLLVDYKNKYVRWWRSQSVRYLMRFPNTHTCMMLNKARHEAFGVRAATRVLRSLTAAQANNSATEEADMDKWIWRDHKPWVPRPLLSVHVRLGDKAREMKMVNFDTYMKLANRWRLRFPHLEDIWLSSEMQDVIESSKLYPGWNFHYTKIPRQTGNTSMTSYERSLGADRSMTNSIVNFLMASDADYFVGALGSTWCFLIDGMRSTSGKLMSGYLSVNMDRYWV